MTARGLPTLIGACYDASSSFLQGPAEAPAAIRRELQSTVSNAWSEGLFLVEPGVAWERWRAQREAPGRGQPVPWELVQPGPVVMITEFRATGYQA